MRAARRIEKRFLPAFALVVTGLFPSFIRHAVATTLRDGFQETTVLSGLEEPTALRFAPDGRVFVAEKSGIIKVFDDLNDPTPTIFADLRTNVHNNLDRGLLGLALHPDFPTIPYVYVLYTFDAEIGGTPPRWGTPDATSDPCPDAGSAGCVVGGRLSRLEAAGDLVTGPEVVLVENWCQQFNSHSIGDLTFGSDGALYVSAGEGASFLFVDYGQTGLPLVNPCGDPPGGIGGEQSAPTAEGGALRAQDLETAADPVTYDGTVLRLDPLTGMPLPDDPLVGGAVADDDPIIAYGLRNPFRLTARPGTSEIWIGDVGWGRWEEIDRIPDTGNVVTENFGWPCYEGPEPQPGFKNTGFDLCARLYGSPGRVTSPFFAYRHQDQLVAGEPCPAGSAAISGLAFYGTGSYPDEYAGALFFADYARGCLWAMPAGGGSDPSVAALRSFAWSTGAPISLTTGPGGDLFYIDFSAGAVRRIEYVGGPNQPPHAVVQADATNGPAPLTIHLDGTSSSDPDPGDTLSYAWDLDGDGELDDAFGPTPEYTYTIPGTYTVRLRVSDGAGLGDIAAVVIRAGNTAPTATIDEPLDGASWRVGDTIPFSGSATDPEQGALPASALSWSLVLHHCPGGCHQHPVESFSGVASGTLTGFDHEYPSYLELRLTAKDKGGLTDTKSVFLYPETVTLTLDSTPEGLVLGFDGDGAATPYVRTVTIGSTHSLAAPTPQELTGVIFEFQSWSDAGAAAHLIVAPVANTTYAGIFGVVCGDCDDGNPCTNDSCDKTRGCVHAAVTDGVPCADTSQCNGTETCQGGMCTPGAPLDCSDEYLCTVDSCDDQAPGGCVHDIASSPLDSSSWVVVNGLDKPGKGVVQVQASLSPPSTGDLDPLQDGLALRLIAADRRILAALAVTGGAPVSRGGIGWTASRHRASWRYKDATGSQSGVLAASVRLKGDPPRVRVDVRARRTFALGATDLPLTLEILASPSPLGCGLATFAGIAAPPPACRFNRQGNRVKCH